MSEMTISEFMELHHRVMKLENISELTKEGMYKILMEIRDEKERTD